VKYISSDYHVVTFRLNDTDEYGSGNRPVPTMGINRIYSNKKESIWSTGWITFLNYGIIQETLQYGN